MGLVEADAGWGWRHMLRAPFEPLKLASFFLFIFVWYASRLLCVSVGTSYQLSEHFVLCLGNGRTCISILCGAAELRRTFVYTSTLNWVMICNKEIIWIENTCDHVNNIFVMYTLNIAIFAFWRGEHTHTHTGWGGDTLARYTTDIDMVAFNILFIIRISKFSFFFFFFSFNKLTFFRQLFIYSLFGLSALARVFRLFLPLF